MKSIFKKKKFFIVLFVVVLVISVIAFLNQNRGIAEVFVNVVSIEAKDIEQIISVKAPLEGIEKADVVSPLNYEIIDIKVNEGDIVKKDQILAILDSEELEQEIGSEENQIELSQLELNDKLKNLQIEYEKAKQNVLDLEESYLQNKELYENEIITKESFDKIEKGLNEARKNLESFNTTDGKVVLSPAELKRIEIQKQELEKKKEDLEKVFIKSPIDGTVTRVNVNLGRYAKDTENKAMFEIENLNKLQMRVSVSEYDIGKIRIGQDVEIFSDVMGSEKAKGTVSRISPTAEQKDNNAMERVIPVIIDIIEMPESLMAGVISTAKIKVDKAENVFAVPSGAIMTDENNQNIVFQLQDDNSIKSIIVETGLETDLETVIKGSELSENMKMIINPDMSLTDGMIVNPNEEQNIK
jgi:RND family efflux transporter MFP subunit